MTEMASRECARQVSNALVELAKSRLSVSSLKVSAG